ncbi:MAG: YDG domain-containing protein, partial [Oscillospiraceae bacterium]
AHIAAAGNYTAADSTNTMALTINRADNSINNSSTTSKFYGENFLIEYNIANADTTQPIFTCEYKERSAADNTYTTTLPTNAGNYTMRVSATETQNYNACSAALDFVINKVPLNVAAGTAEPKKWDGTTTATMTALTFGGLVNGETLALTTDYTVGAPAYDTADAGTNKTVTGTATLVSNATTGNYTL